jgi:hypothetical protein
MSMTSLNFHRVTEATARVIHHVNNSHWLEIHFTDEDGGKLELAVFSESPEALLQALAASVTPACANALETEVMEVGS